jgi:hypothetical protein
MSRHGELTGMYGKKLYDYCQETYPNILTVYYDHGDKENGPNVVATMGYNGQDGEKVQNKNRLTDVDILMVLVCNNPGQCLWR